MRFGISRPDSDSDGDEKRKNLPQGPDPLGREHYGRIEAALGYSFKELDWLERALTHRSVPVSGGKNDYERLEFLGDAVLDLAVAHLLLDAHVDAKEGDLSKMRAALVNTGSLADISREIDLGPFIRLSRGELANGGSDRPSILADVLEAVIGAVYREAGYEPALKCVERIFGDSIKTVKPSDPKTELQEALHASGSEAPEYMLECVEGPEHAPTFVSVVGVDGQVVGRGRGPTKKASQQAAAEQALRRLSEADEIDDAFMVREQAEQKASEEQED